MHTAHTARYKSRTTTYSVNSIVSCISCLGIKMKKASRFLKQLFSAIVAAVRERSTAVRTKTSAARTRLIFLGILRNKKLLMSAINSRIHAIMGGSGRDGRRGGDSSEHGNGGHHLLAGGGGGGDGRKAAALLQALPSFALDQEKNAVVLLNSLPSFVMSQHDGGEQQYDFLARSPLAGGEDDEEEGGCRQLQLAASAPAPPGSVIELARGAAERCGVEFRLEDEIDHVADVFIRRFHDQMKLQKLESFKRFCEMLERN